MLGAACEGERDREILRVAPLEDAGPNDLAFVSGGRLTSKIAKQAADSQAGCLLVPEDFDNAQRRTVIRVRAPRVAVARVIAKLHPIPRPEPGVHPTALLDEGVVLGEGASIGPFVTLGVGVRVGARTSVGAGSVVGD